MKKSNSRVFRAPTWTEAVNKAVAEMGKDIVVIERRTVPRQGKDGILAKLSSGKLGVAGEMVEIEVALDDNRDRNSDLAKKSQDLDKGKEPVKPKQLLEKTYAKAREGATRWAEDNPPPAGMISHGENARGVRQILDKVSAENENTRQTFEAMQRKVMDMMSLAARGGLPRVNGELLDEYRRLVESDIREGLARELVEGVQESIQDGERIDFRECLEQAIAKRICQAGPVLLRPGRPAIVALVGPTGSGKSSTVAKLAVEFTMRRKKTTGLINEDLHRSGAEAQLKGLAMLMSIAMTSADDSDKIREAVRGMSGVDLILLDTAGRSPRDDDGLEELALVLEAAGVDETHLVIPVSASQRMFSECLEKFRKVRFDRLIITKLDEVDTYGTILNVASEMAEGLSYVTTGQKYMESLVAAEPGDLASLILGRRRVDEGGLVEADAGGCKP